jgi:signal transduction histidine kinase
VTPEPADEDEGTALGELSDLGPLEVPGETGIERREESFRVVKDDLPEIRVPIGELGDLVIGISEAELTHRLEVLRQDLVQKASVVGGLTLLIVLSAGVVIWFLLLRARRLEEQASEAERMAYIGTLASGLAHEIRSPLNSLNLNMQMLEEDLTGEGGPSSDRRLLTITRAEISRLERLVTDFLTYAKPRSPEEVEIRPGELFEGVKELLASDLSSRGASLTIRDESGARVKVDPGQMRQMLLNLLQNALAATEESGRPPRLTLRAFSEGGRVTLEVGDNGVGIPAEEQARIFDLFYSTRHGGTGLGLAIVHRIAKVHGGEVSVESQLGEGTRVRVDLPRAEDGSGASEPNR